jgi:hypothetical protein
MSVLSSVLTEQGGGWCASGSRRNKRLRAIHFESAGPDDLGVNSNHIREHWPGLRPVRNRQRAAAAMPRFATRGRKCGLLPGGILVVMMAQFLTDATGMGLWRSSCHRCGSDTHPQEEIHQQPGCPTTHKVLPGRLPHTLQTVPTRISYRA